MTRLFLLFLLLLPAAARAENIVYPADANVVDVSRPPYNAPRDGRGDATGAIQQALNAVTGKRRLLYFPNGTYLLTKTLTVPLADAQGHTQYGFTNLQGQSRDGVVLRLRDGTFPDPAHPQPVLTFGRHGSADWFDSSVRSLTIRTGRGNAGAIALQFFTNNEGCARDLSLISEDGAGVCGLDLAYNDMNGPLLVKNVLVRGFALGVHMGCTVNSQTLEHIRVEGQSRAGVQNDGQMVSLRGLRSVNAVPALVHTGGLLCLLDARLQGIGAAAKTPAIVSTSDLYVRGLHTAGYARALEQATGPDLAEWTSKPAVSLFPSPPHALNLPVRETPTVPDDPPGQWDSPTHHGAKIGTTEDISGAMQAAIDGGATTVYLPTGDWHFAHTVHLRGRVRRLVGLDSYLIPDEPLNSQDAPLFQIDAGAAKTLSIEGLAFGFGNKRVTAFGNASPGTVVIKDVIAPVGWAYRNTPGAGPLFLEDTCLHVEISRETVWARQMNEETEGVHIRNSGGTLWILGLKTERGGTLILTEGGGRTQLDGGLSYTTTKGSLAPMLVNDQSRVSATLGEVCYSGDPFVTILRETRGGAARTLPRTDPAYRQRLVLYAGQGERLPPPKIRAILRHHR